MYKNRNNIIITQKVQGPSDKMARNYRIIYCSYMCMYDEFVTDCLFAFQHSVLVRHSSSWASVLKALYYDVEFCVIIQFLFSSGMQRPKQAHHLVTINNKANIVFIEYAIYLTRQLLTS